MADTNNELTKKVTEIVKKKRGAKWVQELSEDGGELVKPGDNSRFVRYAMASWDLPPIDISDPEQVKERINMYFQHCAENDRRPQVVGMCNWLGISRDTLNSWVNGECRSATHTDIIKKAYLVLEEMWVDYMQHGRISPPTAIFLAKNFFHYRDQTEVVVTPNSPYDGTSEQERAQKYLDGIADPGVNGDGKME